MNLGDGIKERLLAIGALTALVDQRVFELILPQNERRSAVRFFVLGQPRPTHIRGPVNQFAQRVQVDSYVPVGGENPQADVHEIAAAVLGDGLGRDATGLAGWAGIVGAGSSPDDALQILDVEVLDDGQDSFEADEQRRLRTRQEYRVHYRVLT